MKRFIFFGVCLWLALAPELSALPGRTAEERRVMLEIVRNFPSVVAWPGQRGKETPRFCSLGASLLAGMSEEEGQRIFASAQYAGEVTTEEAKHCHVVMLGARPRSEIRAIVRALEPYPVLTVGTSAKFAADGGMIGFLSAEKSLGVFTEKKVRFNVNLARAQSAGIVLDPLLLELAEEIVAP